VTWDFVHRPYVAGWDLQYCVGCRFLSHSSGNLLDRKKHERLNLLRILAISDTHELHRDLDRLPESDLLIHGGDWTFFSKRASAIEDFDEWLAEQPVRCRSVLVPGNHEFYREADRSRRMLTSSAIVLIEEAVTVNGLKIWGSPITPLYGGAFGISDPEKRAAHYATIPSDTHILVTHGPPYGILDGKPGTTEHFGCPELLKAVKRVKPLLHIFGHVHSGYGILQTPDTTFINASLLGPDGYILNKPVLIDLPRRKG
jgi:Icc-related predicted phosphoesterase